MKKTALLFICITLFQFSNSMEQQPQIIAGSIDAKKLIVQEYFSTAHTQLEQCDKEKDKKKELRLYLLKINNIDKEFYSCANDKDMTRIFVRTVVLHQYGCHLFFHLSKVPGIVNYRNQCRNLDKLILSKTEKFIWDETKAVTPTVIAETNQTIKQLVLNGADADCRIESAGYLATTVQRNYYSYAQQLLELGADPNHSPFQDSPLNSAIKNKNIEMIQLLFKFGARNNACLDIGFVTLHPEIAELILCRDDIDVKQLQKFLRIARAINSVDLLNIVFKALKKRNPPREEILP